MSVILRQPWTRQPPVSYAVSRIPLTSRLVLAWNAAASRVDSESGRQLEPSSNLPTVGTGLPGVFQSFSPASSHGLRIPASGVNTAQGLTIHAIARISSAATSSTCTLAGFGSGTAGHYATLDLSGTEANDPVRVIQNASSFGGKYFLAGSSSLFYDRWATFTAVFDDNTANNALYLDGIAQTPTTNINATGTLPSINSFVVGHSFSAAPQNFFNGDIAMIAMWARKLSEAEIRSVSADPWQLFAPRQIIIPVSAGGANVYDVTLTDTATATDAIAATLIAARAASEAASAVDAATAALLAARDAAEATTATETLAAAVTAARAASEAAAASDAAAAQLLATAAASEPASAADTAATTAVRIGVISEAASAADTVASGAASYEVTVTEAASAADAVASLAQLLAAQSETLAAADAVTVTGVFGVQVSAPASAADATNWGGAAYSVALAEAGSLADAVAAALQAVAQAQGAATAGESVVAILSAGVQQLEPAAAVELAAAGMQTSALLTEAATATDLPAWTSGNVVTGSMEEAATAGDAIVAVFIRGFGIITAAPRRLLSGGAVRPAVLSQSRPGNKPGRGR